jgi:hypothetical protein
MRDLRLYWDSWGMDEQCSQESAGVKGKSESFYGGSQGTTRRMKRCWRVVGRVKRRKEDSIHDEDDSRE